MKIIFSLLVFACLGFLGLNNSRYIFDSTSVGNLTLGKSSLEDVVIEYGGTIEKIWEEKGEMEFFGHWEYEVKVDSIGVFSSVNSKETGLIVKKVSINSKYCLTIEGVGVGSSYHEVISKLGAPEIRVNHNLGDGSILHLRYGKSMMINFDGHLKDSNSIRVLYILIKKFD